MAKRAFMYQRRILLDFSFDMKTIKQIKGLSGCEFRNEISRVINGKKKKKQNVWLVDCTELNLKILKELGFDVSEKVVVGVTDKKLKVIPIKNVKGLNATLYDYQAEGLGFIKATNGKALLNFQAGLGKTVTSLAYIQHCKLKKVLIVVPSAVKVMWEREIVKWIGKKSQVLSGRTNGEIKENIVVINYDIIKDWKKTLIKEKYDALIIDEIHYLANSSSQRTKAVRAISKKVEVVIGLSGTPARSRPSQLYSPLKIINSDIFPNKNSYEVRYCNKRKTKWGYDVSGASNLKELGEILRETVMIRKTKAQVMKDLPKVRETEIPIKIDMKEYDVINLDFERWLKDNKKETPATVLTQLSPLRQESLKKKLPIVKDWIDDFLNNDEKIVIFCHHKKGVDELMEKYKKIAVKIDGSVSSTNKQKAIDKFVSSSKIKVAVVNIVSGGTGIDGLQGVCNNVLFLENSYVPAEREQCIARLNRIGQKYSVNVYDIVCEDTIDERILKIIKEKQKVLDEIMDGKKGKRQSSFASSLLKTYR